MSVSLFFFVILSPSRNHETERNGGNKVFLILYKTKSPAGTSANLLEFVKQLKLHREVFKWHMTHDWWHVTEDRWHMTGDNRRHETCEIFFNLGFSPHTSRDSVSLVCQIYSLYWKFDVKSKSIVGTFTFWEDIAILLLCFFL